MTKVASFHQEIIDHSELGKSPAEVAEAVGTSVEYVEIVVEAHEYKEAYHEQVT